MAAGVGVAGAGVAAGGGVGVGEAPADEHADANNAAAIASAPKRRVPFSNSVLLLAGQLDESNLLPGSGRMIEGGA
jgi:hypothetical protein